jgi:hypothetical protein
MFNNTMSERHQFSRKFNIIFMKKRKQQKMNRNEEEGIQIHWKITVASFHLDSTPILDSLSMLFSFLGRCHVMFLTCLELILYDDDDHSLNRNPSLERNEKISIDEKKSCISCVH